MSKDLLKKHYSIIRILELSLDIFFIIFSFLLVVQLDEFVHYGHFFETLATIFRNIFSTYGHAFRTQLLYIFVVAMFFVIYGVSVTKKKYVHVISSLILALVMSNLVVISISILFAEFLVKPHIVLYTLLMQIFVFGLYKYLFYCIIKKTNKRIILIIGPKKEVITLTIKHLLDNQQNRMLKYLLFEEDGEIRDDIIEIIDQVDDIIITQGLSEKHKNNIMTYCISKKHKDVYLVPKLFEINIVNSKVDQIRDTPVFLSQSLHLSITQRFMKRFIDITLSVIILILSSPILLISAILIKAHDKGPVFFKQERITRYNKSFMLYKFRTMIVDAEKETGAVWQMENDPRITKIGKFLRSSRLDELPQLYNVLKGEMSLIGPRPEREIFIAEFIKSIPDFKYRVNVKPGITGLAQVLGKYNSEPDDKLRFDLLYIRNYSFWLDLKILLLTIKAVLDKDAAATLGLPEFDDVLTQFNLSAKKIDMGLEIEENK